MAQRGLNSDKREKTLSMRTLGHLSEEFKQIWLRNGSEMTELGAY